MATSVELSLRRQEDVVVIRQAARTQAATIGLSLVDQTKFVTAASELGRNTVIYGGGGTALVETIQQGAKRGIRITFSDNGPGIPDVERALQDGFTTGGGLGLGLGGARRLVSEFSIDSRVGSGTKVTITQWSSK